MDNPTPKPNPNVVHTWSYCSLCRVNMVLCGTCGNNTCNASFGLVGGTYDNPIWCPDCESAYEYWKSGKDKPPEPPGSRLYTDN